MNKLNNNTNEFEFQEPTSDIEYDTGEFGYETEEFEENPAELVDKSDVVIFTDNYRINGKIALVPGARLTDFIVEAKLFVAVTNVEVKDKAGTLILKTPFLDVHRDHIELIMPAELANIVEVGS